MMDWKDIGSIVKKGAPLLGTILGGPAGAAAGGAISLICSALGVSDETPEAVMAAIQSPDAMVKLKELEYRNRERLEELTLEQSKLDLERERLTVEQEIGQVKEVNATMRDEGKSEHWPQWSWRPFIGFITGISFGWVSWRICDAIMAAVVAKDGAMLASLANVIFMLIGLFGVPSAILGVAAWGRNKLKLNEK